MRLPAQRERRARIPRTRCLELRRRCVAADGVEALDVHLRKAADNRGIVRHVRNAELRRGILAGIRWIREVVPARKPETEITDERRTRDPRQPDRKPLRSIQIGSERVVERPFAEARQRSGAERIGVDEAVACEEARARRELMVDAYVELVLPDFGDRGRCVNRGSRHVRIGNQLDDLRGNRIPTLSRNHPLACRVPAELRATRRERIVDGRREQPGLLRRGRHLPSAWNPLLVAQPLVVGEPERPIAHDRSANRAAELIALALRLGRSKQLRKIVVGVERIVSEELEQAAVHAVGARLDGGVDNGARAAAVFRRIRIRLDLEFLQRLYRRLDELHVFAAERIRVPDVVDAVEQKDVIERAIAVDVQHTLEIHARQPRCAGEHPGGQQCQLVVVAAIQGQVQNLAFVDDQTPRGCLRLQHRRRARHLDRLLNASRLQPSVELKRLGHLQDHSRADELAEAGRFHDNHVLPGTKARDVVEPALVRFGCRGDAGRRIGDGDAGFGYDATRGVRDFTDDRGGVLLRQARQRRAQRHGKDKREERTRGNTHRDTSRRARVATQCKRVVKNR